MVLHPPFLGRYIPLGCSSSPSCFPALNWVRNLGLQLKLDIPRELGGTIIGFIVLFVAAGKLYEEGIVRARDWFTRKRGSNLKGESQ